MTYVSSFTLRFAVEKPIIFQSFSGFASSAIFYNLIKSIDGDFAEKLHSSRKLAPWAASPIFVEFPPPPKAVYRVLQAPSIANVTFTTLDDKLSNVFREAILKPDLHLDLVNVRVRVIGVSINTCRFSDIASNVDPLPEKFAIRFLTPTVFRRSIYDCCPNCPYYVEYMHAARGGRRLDRPCKYAAKRGGVTVPLPIPSLMFKNLARLWSAFSGIDLDVWSVVRWAENTIVIAGFPKPGIRTVRVYEHPTANKWITGFIGTVRFSVKEELYKEDYAKTSAVLLRMAEMTNVGVRRTAGLGMVKYITPKDRSKPT